ncbi:acyltransferase [Oceanibacterium hippocampi]|uniref:Maltose O-acetyltransferase n=1 Tax=Oceanibacterium hippocampi TaxID=745714 RepID=A0A1Y5T9T0_9PROT|nr:acyltransferase [Oceanibacterium hippocampi]SLN55589.1 Maltose O-acetyltransferase [Oceanibacterium hippocampi]
MKIGRVVALFLMPRALITALYLVRSKCFVSPRAEVDFGDTIRIGKGSRVSGFTQVKASDTGRITIGNDTSIAVGCCIAAGAVGITIGDDCLISPGVVILSGNYKYDRLDMPIRKQGYTSKGVTIGNNVWLGSNVVVLDGSVIEDGVIVTPNSVVSSHLKRNTVCEGSPAKVIFRRR